jgi:lyso-ornithine lipid O-acyltransferase
MPADRVYFVSKAEVAAGPASAGWRGRRAPSSLRARAPRPRKQQALFERRLKAGHRLLFFPEGTSTDSIRMLPFKSTLFAAFFSDELRDALHVQPVSIVYHAPGGADVRFYGWWAQMDFGSSLARILAQPRQGRIEVFFHESVAINAFADRKALSAHCERVIRSRT